MPALQRRERNRLMSWMSVIYRFIYYLGLKNGRKSGLMVVIIKFSMVAPRPAGPGGLNNTTLSSGLNSSSNMTMRTPNECSVVR